jgi:uncharacterized protein
MPFAIGVVGVSGGGKSSTVNALFGTDLPVSHTSAGSTGFRNADLPRLRVIDAPGLGEDRDQDRILLRQYREHLPDCAVVLWVLGARHRGLALDQSYLDRLPDLRDRLVFGVNQVDLIAPGDWDRAVNLPSSRQVQHMLEIVEDRKARLATILGVARPVVGYSALRCYRLQELFTEIAAVRPGPINRAKNLQISGVDRERRRQMTFLAREWAAMRQMHP